ncbi:hypothetical protein LTR09_011677 [Extremus antarcticus]|uniref:BTB domain-containing protein n=1 Tax=Extremus antarcticus TaxID=702011 RepID=A0AAJ0GA34_9PEZI|nr:hypothetical protein LTR09_011677 [Extremus antarcticus]
MRTITIDRRGDVVCVAREQLDTDAEFGFLVNSKVLAHGSDFFVALIEGKFEEGIRLANTLSSPVRIDLLGDDVDGLKHFFRVLHHCPEVKQITLKDLAATAQVVDKYQCQHAFHAISRLWLEQHLRAIGAAASLPEYLGIALAFQQPDIERAVVLGIAITTGRLANSSTTKERIQSTMLADQVSQEYCIHVDLYREKIGAHWVTEFLNLASPLVRKRRPKAALTDHSNEELCHQAGDCVPGPNSPHPLLYHVAGLDRFDEAFWFGNREGAVRDNVAADVTVEVQMAICTACRFAEGLSDHLAKVFVCAIGSHRGRTLSELRQPNYDFPDCGPHDNERCDCGFSDAMGLLFHGRLEFALHGEPGVAKLLEFALDQLGLG